MKSDPRRFSASLTASVLLLAGAVHAGDATFLPNDTISVQGVPNIPDDFTIECRVWIPSSSAPIMRDPGPFFPAGAVFTAQRNSAMHTGLCIGPDGVWVKGTTYYYDRLATTMPTNQWCHVAIVRRGASMAVFVNGAQAGTISCAVGQQAIVADADVRIGAPVHNGGGLPGNGFAGRIDWLRISAVARYTAPFTAPDEQALPLSDASTELLLRFNDGAGSASVRDDGVHHRATMVGDSRSFAAGAASSPRLSEPPACPSDLDGDGEVSGADISLLLLDFGTCP